MDKVIKLGEARPLGPGKIFSDPQGKNLKTIEQKRRCNVSWILPGGDADWVYAAVSQYAAELNAKYFGFDLFGFVDNLQYTVYEGASEGGPGHYDWHIDMGVTKAPRKLSIVVNLSEPEDYKGGVLEFRDFSDKRAIAGAGHLHAFPSWAAHRVTPVTKGIRRSLVGWIAGPPFR